MKNTKTYMELQKLLNSQSILSKKNKAKVIILSISELTTKVE